MQLKMVLFDLDGTLLPMEQEVFTKAYFGGLVQKMAPYGYEPKALIDGVWAGTAAMVKNDGRAKNETVFWETFSGIFGQKVLDQMPVFEAYYREEFQETRKVCGFNPRAAETVRTIKRMGLRVALATNPLFPAVATESRIRWTGLDPVEFERYTTYETSHYCKPNLDYYRELLRDLNCLAEDCLMVGNDVSEDMVAEQLGMRVFLLRDCLINRENVEISRYPNGSFDELLQYVNVLVNL